MYHGIPRKVKPGLRFRIDFWFSCIDLRIGPVSFMFGKDFRSGRCGPKMHAPGRRKVAFGFMLRSFEWLPNSGGSNFSHSQSDLADCDVGFSLECKLNYCVGTQTHTHTHTHGLSGLHIQTGRQPHVLLRLTPPNTRRPCCWKPEPRVHWGALPTSSC